MLYAPHSQARPALASSSRIPTPLDQQIAAYLTTLLPGGRPRRIARMCSPLAGAKYYEPPRSAPFGRAQLLDHAAGRATWAATLDQDGTACVGAVDIDEGSRAAVWAFLQAAAAAGVTAYAIAVDSAQHQGGHVWVQFDRPYPIAQIAAQLQVIAQRAQLGTVEIWPGGNQVIRLPFGIHLRANTRGDLFLQSGEIINLDTALGAGLAAVLALPANGAPPAIAAPAAQLIEPAPIRSAPAAHGSGRLSAPETIAAANRANDLGAYLESHGAQLVRTKGAQRYYSGLASEAHSHRHTYSVTPARDGNGQIGYSYSPNGRLNKDDFPRGFRFFDAYLSLEHGGDRVAALKSLTPKRPTCSAGQQGAQLVEPAALTRSPAEHARRVEDAQRKRAQRQQHTAARSAIAAQLDQLASTDPRMYPFARAVLAYHIACWADAPQHYASLQRIARAVLNLNQAATENQIRKIQLTHKKLITWRYLVCTVRYTPGEKNTNCWQPPADGDMVIPIGAAPAPVRADGITMHESSIDSTVYKRLACEGGAAPEPPALGEADSLDTWQAAGDMHGPDELVILDAPALVEPAADLEIAPPSTEPDRALLSRVRHLARTVAEPFWELRDYAGMRRDALLAEAARLEVLIHVPTSPKSENISDVPPVQVVDQAAGASYSPPPVEPSGAYTGRAKHLVDFSTRWRWSSEAISMHSDAAAQLVEPSATQLDQLQACPPAPHDPRYGAFAWRWHAARQLWRSAGQRAYFHRQALALCDYATPSEAARRWQAFNRPAAEPSPARHTRPASIGRAGAGVRPPSQAQLNQLSSGPFVTQAVLFS